MVEQFSPQTHIMSKTSQRNRQDEQIREQWREGTHIDVGVEELRPGVTGQHVDDDHLSPLLHVNQQVAQLPVVLVDQVNALRTNLLKGHNDAAGHQLQHIFCRNNRDCEEKAAVYALIIKLCRVFLPGRFVLSL